MIYFSPMVKQLNNKETKMTDKNSISEHEHHRSGLLHTLTEIAVSGAGAFWLTRNLGWIPVKVLEHLNKGEKKWHSRNRRNICDEVRG